MFFYRRFFRKFFFYKKLYFKFFFLKKKKKNNFKKINKLSPHNIVCGKKLYENKSKKVFNSDILYVYFFKTFNSLNFNKWYVFLKTHQGSYTILPLIKGVHLFIYFTLNPLLKKNILGFYISRVKVGLKVCNLIFKDRLLVSSGGSFGLIYSINKYRCGIILPSLKKIFIKNFNSILGVNFSSIFIKNFFFNKKYHRFKLMTRGIAKNPVDHPNGGNSNTKGSFLTPWSRIAKWSK